MAKVSVQLTGDNKQLKTSVKEGEQAVESSAQSMGDSVQRAADDAEKASKEWDESFKKMRDRVNNVGQAVLGFAAAAGGAIAGLIYLSEQQQKADAALEGQIKRNGEVVGYTTDQLKTMAEQLGQVAGVSDQVVTGVQAITARFSNVRGDAFKRATELALDMSVALGSEAAGAAEKLGEALQSPIDGVGLLEGEGVWLTEGQKALIAEMVKAGDVAGAQGIILEGVSKVYGGAAGQSDTLGKKVANLTDRLTDVGERLGTTLIPFLEQLAPLLENTIGLIEAFTGEWEGAGDSIGQTAENNKAVMDEYFDYWVGGFMSLGEIVKFFFTNFGELSERASLKAQAAWLDLQEDTKHLFGEVIPELLGWLDRNWPEVFTDIGNFTKTVFANMFTNVKGFVEGLARLLSGDEFDFEFVGLTKGFETSLKELPQIAERQITSAEKQIQQRIDSLNKSLEDKWNDALLGVDKTIQQATSAQPQGAGEEIGAPNMEQVNSQEYRQLGVEVEEKAAETLEALKKETIQREKTEKAQEKEAQSNQGAFEGLEALQARIAASAGAAAKEDTRHKEQIEKLKEIADAVLAMGDKIEDLTPQEALQRAIDEQRQAVATLEGLVAAGDTSAEGELADAIGGLGALRGQLEAFNKQALAVQGLRNEAAKGNADAQAMFPTALRGLGELSKQIPQVLTQQEQRLTEKFQTALAQVGRQTRLPQEVVEAQKLAEATRKAAQPKLTDEQLGDIFVKMYEEQKETNRVLKDSEGTRKEAARTAKELNSKLPQPATLG